jgi:hypothetical protein
MSLYKSLAVGMLSHVPGAWALLSGRLVAPSALHCYGIALKHLTMAQQVKPGVPSSLLELGPGGSLGVGIVAMLLGVDRYAGLDVVRYADVEKRGGQLVRDLAQLLQNRQALPNLNGLPPLHPYTDANGFPKWLTQHLQAQPIRAERVAAVVSCVEQLATADQASAAELSMRYVVPWPKSNLSVLGQSDALMSHVALQHVDDPRQVQRSLAGLLRPGATATHQIGYDSHGLAAAWNGHWAIGDGLWHVLMGSRPFLLNRYSHSQQVEAAQAAGFELIEEQRDEQPSAIKRDALAPRFRQFSEADLQTRNGFLLMRRGA